MTTETSRRSFAAYPLLDALRDRRSRRFGEGMKMPGGPLAYESARAGRPLSEDEEAVLAYAACGITGYALAELNYADGEGGTIMSGLVGRTAGSGDGIQTTSLFVMNENGTYYLKRPRDFEPEEIPELIELGRSGGFTDLYRRSRLQLSSERAKAPLHPLFNLPVNRWSLYDTAGTYFLPVSELTQLYINGVLEIFSESTAAFILDERACYKPAGIARFARSRAGHLDDDPQGGRVLTIQQLEQVVAELVSIEQGMVLQNLSLTAQAMGLGGFPHWAAHPFGWLRALGFRTRAIRSSRYVGMPAVLSAVARLLGRDFDVDYTYGLEHQGKPLLTPFTPPYHPSMEAAVRAIVELKFGEEGIFRGGAARSAWKDPRDIASEASPPSPQAVDATIAYCDYVYHRYGRFPAYAPPFRTVLGFQTGHVDVDFYEKRYQAGVLSPTQLRHQEIWHDEG